MSIYLQFGKLVYILFCVTTSYLGALTSVTPILFNSWAIPEGNFPDTSIAYRPRALRLILSHRATQLSSGWHSATIPVKIAVVHDCTISLDRLKPRNCSQLSHPFFSNWSACLIKWHSRQARRLWKSLGIVSDIFRARNDVSWGQQEWLLLSV